MDHAINLVSRHSTDDVLTIIDTFMAETFPRGKGDLRQPPRA
jgi:hypothetical protein